MMVVGIIKDNMYYFVTGIKKVLSRGWITSKLWLAAHSICKGELYYSQCNFFSMHEKARDTGNCQ
jgi:hypothetical protein